MTTEEIEAEVMRRVPITAKEKRGCVQEQLNNLRLRAVARREIREELEKLQHGQESETQKD